MKLDEVVNPILRWGRLYLGIPKSQAAWTKSNVSAFEQAVAAGGAAGFSPELMDRALGTEYRTVPKPRPTAGDPILGKFPAGHEDLGEAVLEHALCLHRVLLLDGDASGAGRSIAQIVVSQVQVYSGDFPNLRDPPPEGGLAPRRAFRADLVVDVGQGEKLVHCELKKGKSGEPPSSAIYQALMYWSQLAGVHAAAVAERIPACNGRRIADDEVWIAAPGNYVARHRELNGIGTRPYAVQALRTFSRWTKPRIRLMRIARVSDSDVRIVEVPFPL